MKRFDIITLFPETIEPYAKASMLGRAQKQKLIAIKAHQLRKYSRDRHHRVDDTPYGGGAGMVMRVEPIFNCINTIKKSSVISPPAIRLSSSKSGEAGHQSSLVRTILFSAKGKRFTQADAHRLAQYDQLIMICGRYEGVDERVAENLVDEEISIGDYVLTGGEIPAMVVVDSVARLLPGVLGNDQSAVEESHSEEGYLEYPQYSKPEVFEGWEVPKILLSGNHAEIEKWRKLHSKNKIQ